MEGGKKMDMALYMNYECQLLTCMESGDNDKPGYYIIDWRELGVCGVLISILGSIPNGAGIML